MSTRVRAGLIVVVALGALTFAGYGAYHVYEQRGAAAARTLARETALPGEEIPCSDIDWTRANPDGRCASTEKDADIVVDEFVAGLRADGVHRVECGCLDPGTPLAACTVEVKTSFRHSMLLIVQAHLGRTGVASGADMEITTRP